MAHGQGMEAVNLAVGQHVAGGVGRPRDADSADVVGDAQGVEVDAVLEQAAVEVLDLWPVGDEDVVAEARIGIADVLPASGVAEFSGARRHRIPGEHIEQVEEAVWLPLVRRCWPR